MLITAEHGKGTKIHISADGEYVLTVDEEFWYSCGHRSGENIDEQQFLKLKSDILHRNAQSKALDMLSRRDYSQKELKDKLRKKFDDDIASDISEKMKDLGLINDESYAERLARDYAERRLMPPERIKYELISKGIEREYAEGVVEELGIDPREQIAELLSRKYSRKLGSEHDRKRTAAALSRMGYGYGDIRAVMSEFASDEDEFYGE